MGSDFGARDGEWGRLRTGGAGSDQRRVGPCYEGGDACYEVPYSNMRTTKKNQNNERRERRSEEEQKSRGKKGTRERNEKENQFCLFFNAFYKNRVIFIYNSFTRILTANELFFQCCAATWLIV